MAVTRINNNQISDASSGNAYLGINAAVKLQNYSVTAGKLANNITYGSDLTITGNLTIQGNTTTVDTTYTTIEDPVILLASNQTGSPAVDIGFIGERGTSQNIAFVWDESASEFVTVYTNDAETNTTVSIASYASFHTKDANVGGNIVVNGTSTLVGNVLGNINGTGNLNYANGYFTGNVTVLGTFTSTSNIVANASGIFYGTAPTGNGAIYAGIAGYTPLGSNVVAQFSGNANSYSQINFQNINTGSASTTEIIVTANNGNDSAYFGAYGVSGSAYVGSSNDIGSAAYPNDTFLYSQGNANGGSGNLVLASNERNGVVRIAANGTNLANIVATFASNGITATGIFNTSGNITGGNLITAGLASVTGNVTGGNLITAGLASVTGNVTGGNIVTAGLGSFGTTVNATGNITGGNIITGGLVSATGNITSSANVAGSNLIASTAVVTPNVNGTTVTITSTGGAITLAPSSNVSVSSKNINNLSDPVQNQDAATKAYVDNMVSTQLSYHQAVTAATTGTLESATGGTITYTQPNGAGNGVGATLTVTGGSFNLIDTANIQTANTRVLVKNQANAALNGVYYWANATALVRTTDADTYGPNSTTDLSINDYFFVQSGNVNAGSAWIVDGPSGTITFGTSSISFAQFSSSQTYTANTQAGILISGTVISAKVDNNTTAFDVGGNIIVKASANLTTPNIGAATGTSLNVTGNLTGAGANISGNVTGGNLLTAGLISATSTITSSANITGGNLLTGGLVSATGTITSSANVIGGNLTTAGQVVATGNVTGGNVTTAGQVSATGNVTGGNLTTAGQVTATGNITGGNLTTAGSATITGNVNGGNVNATAFVGTTVSMSGNITGANVNTGGANGLTLNASTINSNASRIVVNSNSSAIDFAVNGTVANVFYINGTTNTASFGSSTQTTNAVVAFNAPTSVLMPVGNTTQRPGTGVTGMMRFNTTTNGLEVYDNSQWSTVGTPTFTVISDQQFTGDGATVAFTLSSSTQTTNSVIVSINGIVQIPTTAYSVSGTTLTFTEAPQTGDLIDVRGITTTTTITSIANAPGNAVVATSPTTNQVSITGNVVPVSNATQSLGSATQTWKSLYVAGNTIYLGGLQLTAAANTFTIYQSDGVTQANIDVGSIDVSSITSGTSAIGISGVNGDAYITVGGTANVLVASTTGANITGVLAVSGNIVSTGSNGVANIGSATTYFNTVHAKATSAQYADLAENYAADANYAPGTVLSFGGANEVTVSTLEGDRRIAGVVSTNPSYVMNSILKAEHVATIALTGRVPTFVSGPVEKGDMMVSAGNGRAIACATPAIGTVIGKALENHAGGDGVIEVVVGRL